MVVICTANICRSVMAGALIARALTTAGVDAEVASAGVSALVGVGPPPEVVAVMREHGLDVSEHRARQLAPPMVVGADLVLGLTRAHLREAIVMDPSLLRHGFTLKELARRTSMAGPRPEDAGLGAWFASLTADRAVEDLLGRSSDDDFPDPIGKPISAYRTAAGEIAGLVTALVGGTWPTAVLRADGVRAPDSHGSRGIV